MNKLTLILFFFSIIVFSQQETSNIDWHEDFTATMQKAKVEKKLIILYFSGSDWCVPCKKLKEDFFETENFNRYTNSFLFHLVDIPRNNDLLTEKIRIQNYDLLKTYNKNKSFPLVIVLSSKGKILDKISGYSYLRDPRFHFELLDKFL
ncbi:thioredoxin family protein [Aquimarina muelleri]|uniref:Thioredoxin n=1 Tax=Aquimarina muelleri TaxID=279356 RepID=A0A918JXS3_9FLAO|nr:thioredoxin family protein [Aquimarina muelleri]MCX2763788.1 thioredoxin family protein [Aquimarina muelleri]GGX31078.1 thioredoxin [Aquimarina muelleri]